MTMGMTATLAAFDILVHNWALISIVLTLILLISFPIMIIRRYMRLISQLFLDSPVPLGVDVRDYGVPDVELIEFRAFDGHRLCGAFLPSNPDLPVRGTLIFAHELNSDMMSAARYCRGLLDAGYEVFTFEFRGQGRSTGAGQYRSRLWPSDREQADVLGAIAYVEDTLEQQGRPLDIGLLGVSRGAGAIILGAVGVPSVKAIMVDGVFSTDAYLEYLMRRWVSIFAKVRLVYENHRPGFWRFLRWLSIRDAERQLKVRFPAVRKAMPQLGPVPMLFVHGQRDGHIPVAQSELVYDLASGPKFIWICPQAKHNQAVAIQPATYARYSINFFDRYLARWPISGLDGTDALTELAENSQPAGQRNYADYLEPQRGRRTVSR